MEEWNDIEEFMGDVMAKHKVAIMIAVTDRITQMGFRFDTPEAMEEFFKERIVFYDVEYEDITEVWLLEQGSITHGRLLMRMKSTPDLT